MLESVTMLLSGFSEAMVLKNILAAFAGSLVGTLAGILPGLGISGSIALLLPLSYGMEPLTALIMFSGIYYGAMYGGSTTSILVNVPGEGASVVTCLQGHAMAKRGRAGAALCLCALGSFIAGTIGIIGLTFFAPVLSRWALKFGPPEYMMIAALGLILLANMTGKSKVKSYMMILLGMMLGTVGMDTTGTIARYTFGSLNLLEGLEFIMVIMALFGLGEIIDTMIHPVDTTVNHKVRVRDLYPNKEEAKRSVGPIARGSVVGFLMGLLPGPAMSLSTYVSYSIEKKLSKRPKEWDGYGAVEGVAGPESANNAASSAQMIPLLALGLPFSSSAALLVSGFRIHGIVPGPRLMTMYPKLFWGLVASMYIGNLICLILNLPLVPAFAKILKIRMKILMPIVTLITFTGAYALNYSMFDLSMLVLFGFIGWFLAKGEYSLAPIAVGMFLGPQFESSLKQSLNMFDGHISMLFSRPIAGTLTVIMILSILWTIYQSIRKMMSGKEDEVIIEAD